jgi:outer membrane protein
MKFVLRTSLITVLLIGLISTTYTQQIYKLSLQEAIDYAMQNNYDVIYSEKNIEAAKQQMKAATATGLPQLSGSLNYTDNIAIPTVLLPGAFTNPPSQEDIPIQFGTKYNLTAGLNATQLIFSGQYIVGLQTAKIFLEKANIDFFKDKVAIRKQIAESYFNVLSAQEASGVIDTTLKVTKKLAEETRITYEVGFVEDIDVDQLNLLVSDLEANKVYMNNQLSITHAYLKFYLGLGDQDSLVLTDNMENLIENFQNSTVLNQPFEYKENVDYASFEKQREIRWMQVKLEKTNYMPTLAANINLQTNAQRQQWDFFDTNGKWYASSAFGVKLSLPIWSSGERHAKVKQAQIAFDQMIVKENQLITSLKLQYKSALNEYYNAVSVYENKNEARRIAEKIFNKTRTKFSEGMSSSLDILNTQNQYLNAEQQYVTSAAALLKAGEELKKLLTKSIK